MARPPYEPQHMPPELKWEPLIEALSKANRAIAQYNGYLHGMIAPDVLLSPLTTQEAVQSSKIEGTRATLGEVLEFEAGDSQKSADRIEDIREIINYRNASRMAIHILKTKPITLKLIQEIHFSLMDSVRGHNKRRGNFRRNQNWIGRPGCELKDASFVPPSHLHLESHLSDFEKFLNSDQPDPIVHAGIIHAQFELLHPFMDGNGRVGRILIPLYFYKTGLLEHPVFYLSGFLETHRREYYDRLQGISESNQWNEWLEFFLQAIYVQANSNCEKAKNILDLYGRIKFTAGEILRSQFTIQAVDMIFSNPIFSTASFMSRTGTKRGTAHSILKKLESAGIIQTMRHSRGRRSALFVFPELLAIVD